MLNFSPYSMAVISTNADNFGGGQKGNVLPDSFDSYLAVNCKIQRMENITYLRIIFAT